MQLEDLQRDTSSRTALAFVGAGALPEMLTATSLGPIGWGCLLALSALYVYEDSRTGGPLSSSIKSFANRIRVNISNPNILESPSLSPGDRKYVEGRPAEPTKIPRVSHILPRPIRSELGFDRLEHKQVTLGKLADPTPFVGLSDAARRFLSAPLLKLDVDGVTTASDAVMLDSLKRFSELTIVKKYQDLSKGAEIDAQARHSLEQDLVRGTLQMLSDSKIGAALDDISARSLAEKIVWIRNNAPSRTAAVQSIASILAGALYSEAKEGTAEVLLQLSNSRLLAEHLMDAMADISIAAFEDTKVLQSRILYRLKVAVHDIQLIFLGEQLRTRKSLKQSDLYRLLIRASEQIDKRVSAILRYF